MILPKSLEVVVRDVEQVTPTIRMFTLSAADGGLLPAFSAGSHVVVRIPVGGRTLRNPYSLVGDPADRSAWRIAVRRQENSRGGSQALHETIGEGSRLELSPPHNLFPLHKQARRHVFIAGGVGITPIVAHLYEAARAGTPCELHCAVRGPAHAGFVRRIETAFPGLTHTWCRTGGHPLDPARLLRDQPLGTHVYACGPGSLIDAVVAAARGAGWPASHVHSERFGAPPSGEAFEVELRRSGLRVQVAPDQSLLEAIEAAGLAAPFLCRGGACGHCATTVLELDGTLEHHDVFLSPHQRAVGRTIMPCVSRVRGRTIALDL